MSSITSYVLPDSCSHKPITQCMLTAIPCCCSCADKRPMATAYPTYIDGKGMRMQGRRWQRYCRKCYDYWSTLARNVTTSEALTRLVEHGPQLPSTQLLPPTSTSNSPALPESITISPTHTAHIPDMITIERRQARREAIRARAAAALGTIEDVQQPDYESPIGAMFGRAWTRFRDVEQQRRHATFMQGNLDEHTLINEHLDIAYPHAHPNLSRQETDQLPLFPSTLANTAPHNQASELDSTEIQASTRVPFHQRPQNFHSQFYRSDYQRVLLQSLREQRRHYTTHDLRDDPLEDEQLRINPIDAQEPQRPAVKSPDDLKLNMACKICLEQPISVVTDPCMHAAMCRWCAVIWKEEAKDDRGRFDRRLWKCVICRKGIKEAKRFYIE